MFIKFCLFRSTEARASRRYRTLTWNSLISWQLRLCITLTHHAIIWKNLCLALSLVAKCMMDVSQRSNSVARAFASTRLASTAARESSVLTGNTTRQSLSEQVNFPSAIHSQYSDHRPKEKDTRRIESSSRTAAGNSLFNVGKLVQRVMPTLKEPTV